MLSAAGLAGVYGMARLSRIVAASLTLILVAIAFPKVLQDPGRCLVLGLVCVCAVCVILAEVFMFIEDRRRETKQVQREEKRDLAIVEAIVSRTQKGIIKPDGAYDESTVSARIPSS